jgi:hypothetical protein
VIRQLAEQVRTGVPNYFRGHLGNFALPLGARRCGDFARFYAPYNQERAHIKEAQGRCFSMAFAALLRQDYRHLHTSLLELANYEEQFQQRTLQL